MIEFRKWLEVALCTSVLSSFPALQAFDSDSKEVKESLLAAATSPKELLAMQNATYTINFNNISMLEFLRFASKLTNLNFIFEEADVQFSVSLISEEPVTAKNVMAALAQVLRIHDLILLEQDGNVLITKSTRVHQVSPIFSPEQPELVPPNALLVTRVFRLKNATPGTISGIIRSMMSDTALIEVSNETRQLIVTDIATNVEQIASLLESLDKPLSPLEIDTYVVKSVPAEELITLTTQILTPFTGGNPLIFVPQKDTNSIFIVSTPHLIERALVVMEDLDVPAKAAVGKGPLLKRNVFIYQVKNRSLHDLTVELMNIVAQMKAKGVLQPALTQAIEGVDLAEDTNSLVFLADEATTAQLKELLASLDIPTSAKKSTFLIYTPQYRSGQDLYAYIQETARHLKDSGLANAALLQTMGSMRWTPATNSLLFTGDPQSLERIQAILVSMDTPTPFTSKTTEVFIYKPQYASHEQIQNALNGLIPSLQSTNSFSDQTLIKAIQTLHWNADTQAFSVTTDPATVERLKGLFSSFDSPQEATSPLAQGFFLYKLQSAKGDFVIQELKAIAAKIPPIGLKNQNLINAINKLEWVRSNNSLVITGSPDAIEQIKALLVDFDVPTGAPTGAEAFYIYKPIYLPSEEILIILQSLARDMQASGLNDPQLFQTINNGRYVPQTNSLLFTGSQESLDKVKHLLSTVDISTAPGIQKVGTLTFLLYQLRAAPSEQFIASMKSFAQALEKSKTTDRDLADAISTMKYIRENNSVLFTGTEDALKRVEDLAAKFDVLSGPSLPPPPPNREVSSFVIYNPKYLGGEDLISVLCDFMDNLISAGVSNHALFDAINNLKWIPKTSSLLISGDQHTIDQVQNLLQKFDVPSGQASSIESFENTSFLVYKLQYHSGMEIQGALRQIADNLARGATPNSVLSDAINSLQWIQPTNSLIASGPQDVLVRLKELIKNIDSPLRQVFIEVLVIQTALSDIQDFGLQWGSQFKYFDKTLLQTGNLTVPSSAGSSIPQSLGPILQKVNGTPGTLTNTLIPYAIGFDLGAIGDIIMHKGRSFISLGSLLTALQQDTNSTIVINQKLITQDNRQSTVFSGQNVPYTGSIVTNQSNSSITTSNLEYRDIWINLTIMPILGEDNIITLDIVQDLSSVVGNAANAVSNSTVTGILTNHSHMETRVTVPDNKFIVLSGVINDSKQRFRTGIPCLGSLPVVGLLFSESDRTNGKNNIIIFIRPKIIDTFEDYKGVTEHQEWVFKDQARLPVLKEEFDEGLDIVKSPEDE